MKKKSVSELISTANYIDIFSLSKRHSQFKSKFTQVSALIYK